MPLARFLVLLIGMAFAVHCGAQHFPDIEHLVVRGDAQEALQAIQAKQHGAFSTEQHIELLRLEGDAYAMMGKLHAASASYRQVENLIRTDESNAALLCLQHILLARADYWEIQADEALQHADSALHYLSLCSHNDIVRYRLFQAWNVAAQAMKLSLALPVETRFSAFFVPVHELCLQAISFIESEDLPPYYLSEALHIYGNTHTDLVNFHLDPPALLERNFKKAISIYQREIAVLTDAYGPNHPRIGQAWLTIYFVHQYAKCHPQQVDSVAQIAREAIFPKDNFGPPADIANALMFLYNHCDFILLNSDALGGEAVLAQHEDLNTLAWTHWRTLLAGEDGQNEMNMNALYGISPARGETHREVWKYRHQGDADVRNLFRLDQYVKYFDVLIKRHGTVEPPLIELTQFQNSLKEGQALFSILGIEGKQPAFLFVNRDTAFVDIFSTPFFDYTGKLKQALYLRTPDYEELATRRGQELAAAIPLHTCTELFVNFSPSHEPFPLEVLLLAPPADGQGYRDYAYLGNTITVRYLFNTGLFVEPAQPVAFEVAAFNPRYSDVTRQLPFSEALAAEMAARHPSWKNITKSALKSFLQQPAPMLHLALHGDKRSDRPQETVLHGEGEFLTLADISKQHVVADFVVVNACFSADGRMRGVHGSESPARGLMLAGAEGVISNLWAVDDQASSRLFSFYYDFLEGGLPSHQALASAKRKFIQEARNDQEAHPFYWAAPLHQGNSIVVVNQANPPNFGLILFAVLLCIACTAYLYQHRKRNHRRTREVRPTDTNLGQRTAK